MAQPNGAQGNLLQPHGAAGQQNGAGAQLNNKGLQQVGQPPAGPAGLPNAAGQPNAAGDVNAQGPLRADQQQAVNDAAFGAQRAQYQQDMDANPTLIDALGHADLHPDADGLVRVEQAINKDPTNWQKVVDAAHTVTLMGGKSPGANMQLGQAMKDFAKATGLRQTDTADMAYLLARIMMKDDETNRTDSVNKLKAALDAAKKQLEKLEADRNDPNKNATQAVSGDSGGGGKKDSGGGNNQAQQAVAANEQINAQQKALDAQIENQKKLIQDIQTKIDAGGANAGQQGQTNQELITEAILAMVENAHAMAQLNAAAGQGVQPQKVGAPAGGNQQQQNPGGGGAKP